MRLVHRGRRIGSSLRRVRGYVRSCEDFGGMIVQEGVSECVMMRTLAA